MKAIPRVGVLAPSETLLAGKVRYAEAVAGNPATSRRPWQTSAMANVEKLSVAPTSEMVTELRAAVASGDYGSASEVVRDAPRDWRMRRKIESLEIEEPRRLVREGIDSGPGLEADAVFARRHALFGGPPAV
ncbi:MAG TPA: type II toxin-antitoxin system ParD family antitoxin [Acetobacteraceae bacterium]|nr:type II toxin-antitoxin system ParD family antitoxin [Acetobacteraceae bacterium]